MNKKFKLCLQCKATEKDMDIPMCPRCIVGLFELDKITTDTDETTKEHDDNAAE